MTRWFWSLFGWSYSVHGTCTLWLQGEGGAGVDALIAAMERGEFNDWTFVLKFRRS